MDEASQVSPEELARDVLENLLEGCQVIGFDWTYLYVNDVVARHAQRSRRDLLGRTMMACFPGIEHSPMFATLQHCMIERTHARMENEFTYPDGTAGWFELRFFPVPEGVCVLSLDVSESRRMAVALSRNEEQLRQLQKMEAVGRLAGGIAHDFNNLLAVILGYAGVSLDGLAPAGALRSNLEEIRKAGERGAALTRQLLTFSRQQPLSPQVVDLNEVVHGIAPMIRRLVDESIEMRQSLTPRLGRVRADRGQLEQVLVNLVVNARDAMPTGGVLGIETQNVELDETYAIEHLGVAPGPYVMVAVSDTGIGMDRETQARIFEPFFTTKEPGRGTGLGLTTVFGIARQGRGSVWVYSEPGRGSTFKVYLPRFDGATPEARAPERALRAGGSETVLLVEDDAQLRALTRTILERGGYRVLEATNGPEALLLSEQASAPIHLLLTDVVMPHMAGPELAERFSRRHPDARVAFVSGYTEESMLHQHAVARGVPVLEKPFTPDALLGKVRDVLDTPIVS